MTKVNKTVCGWCGKETDGSEFCSTGCEVLCMDAYKQDMQEQAGVEMMECPCCGDLHPIGEICYNCAEM